ncbi:unnamed protein product [Ectocarpus sp. 13 AM-2016]
MQDELQRLQVQVSDKYRSSAESASEQLRLMKEAQLLQDQLKHSNERLEKLQVEHGVSMSRCTTLEDENALSESALASLRAETESLRNMLGGREAEAVVLREEARKEREELMSRLLKDKERYSIPLPSKGQKDVQHSFVEVCRTERTHQIDHE